MGRGFRSECLVEMKKLSREQIEQIRKTVHKEEKVSAGHRVIVYKGISQTAKELGIPRIAIYGLTIKGLL